MHYEIINCIQVLTICGHVLGVVDSLCNLSFLHHFCWSMLRLSVCNAVETLSVLRLVAIISKLVVLCW